jgi:acetyl-CoA carboxylase biotin carboxyl carrier protein
MSKLNYDNIDYLKELAELVKAQELSELRLEDGESRIILRREKEVVSISASPVATALPISAPPAAEPAASAAASPAAAEEGQVVTSPMVGTVYLSPEPGKPSFVKVGDKVNEGQTLLIIEAMKVMNPLAAPASGTIKAIHVEDSSPIEFGQPLLVIA